MTYFCFGILTTSFLLKKPPKKFGDLAICTHFTRSRITLCPQFTMVLPFGGYSNSNNNHFADNLQAFLETIRAKGIIWAYV